MTWAFGRGLGPALLLLGCMLLGCSGCVPAESHAPPSTTAAITPTAAKTDRQFWDVLLIDGVRVGYARTTISQQRQGGQQLVRVDGLSRMKFKRAGQQVELAIRFGSLETPDGKLLEFESQISQGPAQMQRTSGRVVGDQLQIQLTTLGKKLPTSIPWSENYSGPLGAQQTLWQKPMKPGQRRTIHELVPGANVVGTTELVAGDYERVQLLGETDNLLRIDTTTTFPDGQRQRGTIWTDRSGQILRSLQEAMNLESIRAAKAVALAESDRAEFDLVLGLSVKVDRALQRPHDTKLIRYRLHLEDDDPAQVFASGPSQQVRSIDPHTAEVTVWAIRPGRPGNPDATHDPPTQDDLKPNNLIQSDNPKIVEIARQVAGQQKDPWLAVLALEKYVHTHMTLTDYSQAFATAAEVVDSGQGDCTEHAVLLAALARARGIPARVAIGLVYTEETGAAAFGYHMWNEVCVDDRWIPLDAILGRGGIGAAHLKLAHSNLEGASALTSFLPVAQVAGRLRIEILDVK